MAVTKTGAEKRSFYNVGDAKGFTKKKFFEAVAEMASGRELDPEVFDLVARAAEYELEGIALKPTKATGEPKDVLQSGYAKKIRTDIKPFLTAKEPLSAKELVDMATAKGRVGDTGKPYSAPWVSRVLQNEPGVLTVRKVVESVDTKGLKAQKEVNAFQIDPTYKA